MDSGALVANHDTKRDRSPVGRLAATIGAHSIARRVGYKRHRSFALVEQRGEVRGRCALLRVVLSDEQLHLIRTKLSCDAFLDVSEPILEIFVALSLKSNE